ncbi:hypothetical protein RINTHM_13500 [Richelia intracellularis HM01]|nr:hypothetical protein RINTHM_13500 [Richelia intracellularis HM01]
MRWQKTAKIFPNQILFNKNKLSSGNILTRNISQYQRSYLLLK